MPEGVCDRVDVLVLAAAGNKSTMQPPIPLPGCGGEWKTNRQKLVGRDKGSLTEQQTGGTVTTMIQVRRKHNTNRTTQRAALLDRTGARTPELRVSSRRPAPPHRNPT